MKKTMKKMVALLCCLALVTVAFAGCAGTKPANEPEATPAAGDESAAPSGEVETITLRIGAGHTPESGQWIKVIEDFFMPEIDARLEGTGYEIEWVTAWGGSVAKLGEVLEAIETGLLDIGYIVYVFEPSKLMLQGMTYRMPFQSGDPLLVAEASAYMYDKYPEFKEDFNKYNQSCLAVSVSDPYNMYANFDVKSYTDLEGVKVGAAGANLSWIENTGAVPVQTNLNECFTCLQTGVYDATIQPTGACYKLQVHTEAPYLLEAHFGVQSFGAISMNNDTLAGLPEEVKSVIEEVSVEYQTKEAEYILQRYEEDKAGMEAEGTTIYTLPQEERVKWAAMLPNVVGDLCDELTELGYPAKDIISDYYGFLQENGYEMIRDWELN